MRGSVYIFRELMIPIAVGTLALVGVGIGIPSTVQAENEMIVDITITDQGYDVKGVTTAGSLTKIVVRNQGSMTHGITSPVFKEGVIRKEGDGVEIQGKAFKAYHLESGQSMTLYFKKESHRDQATGTIETNQVPVWCDILSHLKGEFLVFETSSEMSG